MPRIRTLKPEFFRSPDTAKTSFAGRIFYEALWCWADDFGIGETNLNGLLGFAFCDEDGFTAQDLRQFCAEVALHYGVVFYTVRGRHYYAVPSWEKHQKLEKRPERRRHPVPDDPEAVPDQRIHDRADSAPDVRRTDGADPGESSAGTGEPGNRGTGDIPSGADAAAPPAEPGSASPEQIATANAYARVGKAFKFMAVRQIAKWAIHDRGAEAAAVEEAFVGLYELGKPITKQTVGQWLDGRISGSPSANGQSRADAKVQGYLDMGRRVTSRTTGQKEIE